MSFPAYPDYRDSGVEWLGVVPAYWESWKVSHAFGELGSGTTPPTSEVEWYEGGTVPWVTTGELRESVVWETKKLLSTAALSAFSALRLHPAGSLAIAMYGATIGRLGILGIDATTNQACCLLTRPNHLHIKFTFFWLLAFKQHIIDLYASGGGQPNINQEIISNLKIPAPEVREQIQIARFLDHETARIDTLIEEQQSLIELLKEKRQAVISHVVTKGLDPTMPMKDSGVEWLGEVPVHWDISRLKYHSTKIGDGLHATPEYDDEGDYFFINGNNLVDGEIVTNSTTRKVNFQEFLKHRVQLDSSTVLISINGTIGNLALYNSEPVILGKSAAYINCTESLSRSFCLYLFSSEQIKRFFDSQLTGTTIYNLSLRTVAETPTPLPPLDEQTSIVKFLNQRIAEFDELIDNAVQLSKLLQERRSALISAAVTGKIDVRGWQPTANAPSHELEQEAL